MAASTSKRTYPNDYFAWYNDDNRIGIINKVTSTDNNEGFKSGEYDTYSDSTVTAGLKIHYHAKYEEATATTDNLQSGLGLDSALHNAVLCYVKSRLYEDDEDLEYSQYFRAMYENKIKKFRGRRSAVRHLAVPRL